MEPVTLDAPTPEIEIYTQPACWYCAHAKRLLTAKGVPFREIIAPRGSAARAEAISRSGGRTTVPQIFIGGEPIGGADELALLEASGELDRKLGSAAAMPAKS